MLVGEVNATHHVIALPDHPDLPRSLDEIKRLRWKEQLPGNTAGIASRLRGKRKPAFTTQHFFIRREHLRSRPGFQDRVLIVADSQCDLPRAIKIPMKRMIGIVLDGTAKPGRSVEPVRAHGKPCERGRCEFRDRIFRRGLSKRDRSHRRTGGGWAGWAGGATPP